MIHLLWVAIAIIVATVAFQLFFIFPKSSSSIQKWVMRLIGVGMISGLLVVCHLII
jgi:hypothetical protein